MYNKQNDKRIKLTKNLYLKEVTLRDVKYIFKLRSNKFLTRYINPRKNDLLINNLAG